jgi:hypothetical protein
MSRTQIGSRDSTPPAKIQRENKPDYARALFRFISRNETKLTHHATEEELLQEIVDELKDAFEDDLEAGADETRRDEEFDVKYPSFMTKAQDKAEKFKQTLKGYRRICCLPSFSFGLVMALRIHSHYIHAPWFRLGSLDAMIDVHGTVSDPIQSPKRPPTHGTHHAPSDTT